MKMVDVYQNTRAVQIVSMDTKMMKAGNVFQITYHRVT